MSLTNVIVVPLIVWRHFTLYFSFHTFSHFRNYQVRGTSVTRDVTVCLFFTCRRDTCEVYAIPQRSCAQTSQWESPVGAATRTPSCWLVDVAKRVRRNARPSQRRRYRW